MRAVFAELIIIISYISGMLFHFRKRFPVNFPPSCWSLFTPGQWGLGLHLTARKLRVREIKVMSKKSILSQDISPCVLASEWVFFWHQDVFWDKLPHLEILQRQCQDNDNINKSKPWQNSQYLSSTMPSIWQLLAQLSLKRNYKTGAFRSPFAGGLQWVRLLVQGCGWDWKARFSPWHLIPLKDGP